MVQIAFESHGFNRGNKSIRKERINLLGAFENKESLMLLSTQEKKSTRANKNFTFTAITRYERKETKQKPNKGT